MATSEEKNAFYVEIENVVRDKDLNWYEAILYYCQHTGLEPQVAGELTNDKLRKKIEPIVRDLHLLKKDTKRRLPI